MDQIKSIANFFQSDKGRSALLVITGVLLASGSFLLGRFSLAGDTHQNVDILSPKEEGFAEAENTAAAVVALQKNEPVKKQATPSAVVSSEAGGKYVASKSGSAYHFPWCSGAKRIKEENKIYFNTKEEAEKAGYHPAGNCKGL